MISNNDRAAVSPVASFRDNTVTKKAWVNNSLKIKELIDVECMPCYIFEKGVSCDFKGDVSKNKKATIWRLYRFYINVEKNEEESASLHERAQKTQKLLDNRSTEKSFLDKPLENDPQGYFKAAKVWQKAIKSNVISRAQKREKFVIQNNCFKKRLDCAERTVIKIFEDLFVFYFDKQDLARALEVVKKMRLTEQGTKAYLKLSSSYFFKGEREKASLCLNSLSLACIPSALSSSFFSEIKQSGKATEWFSLIKTLSNQAVKDALIKEFVKDKIAHNQMQEALDCIKETTRGRYRNALYKKAAEASLNRQEISQAVNIVKLIDSGYTRAQGYIGTYKNSLYQKAIEASLNAKDLSEALNIVKLIDNSSIRNSECKKLAAKYLDKQEISQAVNTLKLIDNICIRHQEYQSLMNNLLIQGKSLEVKEFISLIKEEYAAVFSSLSLTEKT